MYLDKKIIAIIPARGGSKGIKNKNIVNVCGKPLIGYTIEAAQRSKYIDHIYVSTDCTQISRVCRDYGLEVNELRPKRLSTDESLIIDVLKYTLSLFDYNKFDYVMLLQPTQPLRLTKHIDEAIELIVPNEVESIVSVSEVTEHPLFMRSIMNNGKLKSILNVSSTVRRQDLDHFYRVNGVIYINSVKSILNDNISLNDNQFPYIMDNIFDLDIDDPSDLEKLIRIITQENSNENLSPS